MKIEGEKLIFSDGLVRTANCGIVGLSPEGYVTGGYDDWIFDADSPDKGYLYLTPLQCAELAEHMIERWQAFKRKHGYPDWKE